MTDKLREAMRALLDGSGILAGRRRLFDRAELESLLAAHPAPRRSGATWRVGRTLGRTLYRDEVFVGTVDTPELAAELVEAANSWVTPPATERR